MYVNPVEGKYRTKNLFEPDIIVVSVVVPPMTRLEELSTSTPFIEVVPDVPPINLGNLFEPQEIDFTEATVKTLLSCYLTALHYE